MSTLKGTFHAVAAVALGAVLASPGPVQAAGKVRIAFGDIASVESLHILSALECAKERGVQVEVTYLKSEDIAAQAVASGQADIGIGAPYSMLQKVKAPIRMFVQLAPLRFYPIVNTEFYKTWKDLNGQDVAVHSRGSGTEAIMKLMAQKNGITYSNISYVPGAEVRAGALLRGNVKATIVDAANRRMLMEKAPAKFAVLPVEGISATDEAMFANREYLEREAASVDTLVECVLTTWRNVAANPDSVTELRAKYKLLPDLPASLESGVTPYFREVAEAKGLPLNGGGEAAVKDDLAFFTLSGQLEGDPASLKAEDFWDLRPLNRVLAKVGSK